MFGGQKILNRKPCTIQKHSEGTPKHAKIKNTLTHACEHECKQTTKTGLACKNLEIILGFSVENISHQLIRHDYITGRADNDSAD